MRTIMSFLLITLFSFGLVINEASAKRFGGGRSFGIQRSAGSYSNSGFKQPTANRTGKSTNRWGGMLGGLLVGGLLASLFMGNGLASGLLSWLAVGAVIFLLIGFFRKKMQPALQSAQNNPFRSNNMDSFKQNIAEKYQQFTASNPAAGSGLSFDVNDFLREAKVKFIRLQAAYDQKNMDDIRAFTSPEVLAEIQMQFEEQEEEYNKTEVVSLDAELLDADDTTASVRFTGLVKENSDNALPFNEIWHFRKSYDNVSWTVSGVQQTSHG